MHQPSYLIVTGLALLFVIIFGKHVIRLNNTFFIFDAIGLGLFTVVGIEKSLLAGFPMWVAIIMGMTTGAVGGVIRDIFINEEPLIFRKDIYAIACILGGFIYFACDALGIGHVTTQVVTAGSVILARVVAVKYHILSLIHIYNLFQHFIHSNSCRKFTRIVIHVRNIFISVIQNRSRSV